MVDVNSHPDKDQSNEYSDRFAYSSDIDVTLNYSVPGELFNIFNLVDVNIHPDIDGSNEDFGPLVYSGDSD